MIINYFKIAFRNLERNKAFSFINIFGLAVGLATCTLIMLYIFSEVISEEVAEKMFGNENPVGKPISIGLPFGNFNYSVTGVFKDASLKSHIPAHFFLSMRNGDIGNWVDGQTNLSLI